MWKALRPSTARALIALAGLASLLVSPASGGAAAGSGPSLRADQLRQHVRALADRSQAALAEASSLEARIAEAEARLSLLRQRAHSLETHQEQTRRQLRIARRALAIAQRGQAERVRELYERGEPDPIAVLLGAVTLNDALTGLEHLSRVALLDRRVAAQASGARDSLGSLMQTLAARQERLESLTREGETAAATLAGARAERLALAARLGAERRSTSLRISALEDRLPALGGSAPVVEEVEEPKAEPAPETPVTAPYREAQPGSVMAVTAVGYALRGTTATGMRTGWGVVAVDPSVIPLGTRMTIPGYGEGVAADTGSAIVGAMIDLWFPTTAQALAWGRRTVRIVLHR